MDHRPAPDIFTIEVAIDQIGGQSVANSDQVATGRIERV